MKYLDVLDVLFCFFQVNDWFDCLNVRVPYSDSRDRVQGYGLKLDVQNKIINEMSEAMKTLRVKGKKSLMPFQKGGLLCF